MSKGGKRTLGARLKTATAWLTAIGLVLGTWSVLYIRSYLSQPIAEEGGFRTVIIPRGAHFNEIMGRLVSMGVVRNRMIFEYYVRSKGYATELKAGAYQIDLRATPRELLTQLVSGAALEEVSVTVPEGYNRWQIADTLGGLGLVDREAFLAKVEREGLEGRLFPDTYRLGKNWSLDRIVATFTERFDVVYGEVIAGHPQAAHLVTPLARAHLLTIASLIEKEAQHPDDRRLISRVFHNRLAKKMKLQTDPTCVYGPLIYTRRPTPGLCKDPASTYSTYVIKGLPPTPIANPGRASLEAALYPATGETAAKLLYFVAKRDGSRQHHFSATYDEHRAAVKRHLNPSEDP